MKKALVIGVDNYSSCPLNCCINDALGVKDVLERNADGSPNFATKVCLDASAGDIEYQISELFKGEDQIALLYYAGHGYCKSKEHECGIVGCDEIPVSIDYIMKQVNQSKHKHKILIFDSCFSGGVADVNCDLFGYNDTVSALVSGVTIMAACRANQTAQESMEGQHGVFTSLLLDALYGGAANLLGDISPGSIYAYVDRSLGPWEQRPVFKTNVDSFCSVRKTLPPIEASILRKIPEYFPASSFEFPLDPSYEYTNSLKVTHEVMEPYADERNVSKFKELQKLAALGLVVPMGEEHMYFAAMKGKACKLTALGSFYWQLAKEGKI